MVYIITTITMKYPIISTIVLTLLVAGSASHAQAGDINYGSITAQAGDRMHIEYRSPAGPQHYICTISGSCTGYGTTSPSLLPSIAGMQEYVRNPQGTLGVRQFTLGTISYYVLYDLTKNPPQNRGMLPIVPPVSSLHFSADGNNLVILSPDNAQRYNITSAKMGPRVALSQQDLPFRAISPKGTYLSAYNYGLEGHRVWNLTDGTHFTIPSTAPSYVEFSESERYAAYANHVDGFKTLYVFPVAKLPTLVSTPLTQPPALVEDYLFVADTLFFLANKQHPLTWSLLAYAPDEKDATIQTIDKEVSYGDFIKRVDGAVAYLKVEGKNTNVVTYNPTTNTKHTIAPVATSSATKGITREAVQIAGRYGALLSPDDTKRADTLYIWLHGGPQRQTSVGYHPYLSYAVYDELLERFAESGAYVLKLDYTGSWGYGKDFIEDLHLNIGIKDIADINRAIDEMKKEYGVKKVYLIGNSYGGYLALKGIAELPQKVDGAVSINGVSNWYSLISRIPSSPFSTLFEGAPDQHNLKSYFSSEVFTGLVEHVRDQPIVVVYGERDSTVPVWQSTEYIEFAKEKGKHITTLALPSEDHILRSRESLNLLCETVKDALDQPRISCKQ